tara:strand:+ start:674 stop:1738 length:1065 start_codon:yes stop_codon:yes gene_type:complete
MKRIPSLDGLRCISILLVIIGHSGFNLYGIKIANLGVRIFFVISSFLIIGLLLKDLEKNRFSIKRFYFKRIMRTFPAFYFYLFFTGSFLYSINIFEWEQFWRSIFYIENYHPRNNWTKVQWFVGHSWSLAVEEQFYIISSLIFILLQKNLIQKKSLNKIFYFTIIISPLLRVSYIFFKEFLPDFLILSKGRSFETVADALAVGGIIILNKNQIKSFRIFKYLCKNIIYCVLLIILTELLRSHLIPEEYSLKLKIVYELFGQTVGNILIGIIILYTIEYEPKTSIILRLLNNKLSIKIGLLSYSIYLWQQIWLYDWEIHLMYKYFGIIFSALVSYYIIERPFLNFRDKISNKYLN